ncbi:MAG: hypothetical protein Kow00129_11370 [Thermoleophilia bacterium]
MSNPPSRDGKCDTCFFGVEQLCCLRVEGAACPTYRAASAESTICFRRRAREKRSLTGGEKRQVAGRPA